MKCAKEWQNKRRNRAVFFLLLLLIAVPIYLLNAHTPLMMDDYDYSFSWATGELLSGIGDVFASQMEHYRLWGGRAVTHTLAQLFLCGEKTLFNVVNTLMYLCLLLEIYGLARRKGSVWDWKILLLSHAALFCLLPFFGVVFLWLDGACNYLFGTVLALLPLLIARSEREDGFFDAGVKRGVLALPACFVAGWTNENTACGVLAVIILLIIYDWFRGRKVRTWRVVAMAFEAIGVVLMLLAPGNFARSAEASSRGMTMELIYRFSVVSYCLVRYVGVLLVLLFIAFAVARRRHVALHAERLTMLGAAACLCAYALVGSPQISDRSFIGVFVLVLSAALSVYVCIPHGSRNRAVLLAITIVLALGSYMAVGDVKAHEEKWNAQLAIIETAKREGMSTVEILPVESNSRFTMDIALEEDASSWPNSTLGKYFGIRITAP